MSLKLNFLFLTMVIFIGLNSVNPNAAEPMYEKGNGNVTLITDSLTLRVTGGGNVPKYDFWPTSDPDNSYSVMFSQIYEVEDGLGGQEGVYEPEFDSKIPGTTQALAPFSWEFSEFNVVEEGGEVTEIHFNITSTSGPGNIDWQIQFNNHLYIDTDFEIKFDVIINEYEFTGENNLVLSAKLDGEEDIEQENDELNFGDAYFNIEDTAEVGDEQINVGLSSGDESGDSRIYLTYEHFHGDLFHDPSLGIRTSGIGITSTMIDSSDSESTDTQSTDNQSTVETLEPSSMGNRGSFPTVQSGGLISSALIASAIFLGLPTILSKMKK